MIAKLYDGLRLVGQLEVGSRKPHTIRITHSLTGQIVRLGVGLGDRLVPAGQITEIYTKRLAIGIAANKSQVSYVLSKRIGLDEGVEQRRYQDGPAGRRGSKVGSLRGSHRPG